MKRYTLFLILIICFCSTLSSQIIRGTVLVKNTNRAVDHALVYFYRNGYFDGRALIWEGLMEKQRIGDMLPYDYVCLKSLD